MSALRHSVRKETLRVTVDSGALAFTLQPRLQELNRTAFLEVIDAVFSEFATSDRHIRIERLAIDLGAIPIAELEWVAVQRFERALREALHKALHDAETRPSVANLSQPTSAAALELVEGYLLTGTLPFWAPAHTFSLETLLAEIASTNSDGLARLFRRHGTNALLFRRLAHQLNGEARRHLLLAGPVLRHFDRADLEALVRRLDPEHADAIVADVTGLTDLALISARADLDASRLLWLIAVDARLESMSRPFNRPNFVRSIVAGIATSEGRSAREIVSTILASWPARQSNAASLQAIVEHLGDDGAVARSPVVEWTEEARRTFARYDRADAALYYVRHGVLPWSFLLGQASLTVDDALGALSDVPLARLQVTLVDLAADARIRVWHRVLGEMAEETLVDLVAALIPQMDTPSAARWADVAAGVDPSDQLWVIASVIAGVDDTGTAQDEGERAAIRRRTPSAADSVAYEAPALRLLLRLIGAIDHGGEVGRQLVRALEKVGAIDSSQPPLSGEATATATTVTLLVAALSASLVGERIDTDGGAPLVNRSDARDRGTRATSDAVSRADDARAVRLLLDVIDRDEEVGRHLVRALERVAGRAIAGGEPLPIDTGQPQPLPDAGSAVTRLIAALTDSLSGPRGETDVGPPQTRLSDAPVHGTRLATTQDATQDTTHGASQDANRDDGQVTRDRLAVELQAVLRNIEPGERVQTWRATVDAIVEREPGLARRDRHEERERPGASTSESTDGSGWPAHRLRSVLASRARASHGAGANEPSSTTLLTTLIREDVDAARQFVRALKAAGLRPSSLIDDGATPSAIDTLRQLLSPEAASRVARLVELISGLPSSDPLRMDTAIPGVILRAALDHDTADAFARAVLTGVARRLGGESPPSTAALFDEAERDAAKGNESALASIQIQDFVAALRNMTTEAAGPATDASGPAMLSSEESLALEWLWHPDGISATGAAGPARLSEDVLRHALLRAMEHAPARVHEVVVERVTDPEVRRRWATVLSESELVRIAHVLDPRRHGELLAAAELLFSSWLTVTSDREVGATGRATFWASLLEALSSVSGPAGPLARLVGAFFTEFGARSGDASGRSPADRAETGERLMDEAVRVVANAGDAAMGAILARERTTLLALWRADTPARRPPVTRQPAARGVGESPPRATRVRTRTAFSMDEDADEVGDAPIYIANAGLILASPFLPQLFQSLEMLEQTEAGAKRLIPEQVSRAVHLLQSLVDGRTSAPEPLLCLNKLLCGVPLPTPIERVIEPTPRERDLCRALLTSMIANWPIIRNTSVEGLQETFLQREGRLQQKPDGWRLVVQRKTLDVLLDRIPWSISTIIHPWMPAPIFVTW